MSVVRRRHNRNFTVLTNDVMNDERLSAPALAVLVWLLSRPNNWNVITATVAKRFSMGRDKMHGIFRELKDLGYLTRAYVREQGRIVGTEYVVYDEPQPDESADAQETDSPEPEKPDPVKPAPVNPSAIVNNNTTKSPKPPEPVPAALPEECTATPPVRGSEGSGDDRQAQSASTPHPVAERPAEKAPIVPGSEAAGQPSEGLSDQHADRRDEFEEFWSHYRPRNPRFRDDARKRWNALTVEERAQATSRLAQYFGHCQAEAKKRNRERASYASAAEYLGDRIFRKFAPALHAPVPKPAARRLRGAEAVETPLGYQAACEGWIIALFDHVERSGRLPDAPQVIGDLRRQGQRSASEREAMLRAGEPTGDIDRLKWTVAVAAAGRAKRLAEKAFDAARARDELDDEMIGEREFS